MREKKREGWVKHLDFILLDILCQQISFILAYDFRHGIGNPYRNPDYMNLALVFTLMNFCVSIIFKSYKNVLKRGYEREFIATLRHVFLVEGLVLFCLFSMQRGSEYSRIFFYLMFLLYAGLTFICRILWKKNLKRKKLRGSRALLIVAPRERIEKNIQNICGTNYDTFCSVGAIVTDTDMKGEVISNIPVVTNYGEALDYIRKEWVDEVFISCRLEEDYPEELIEALNRMGVVSHVSLIKTDEIRESRQQIERFGNYIVLTTSLNYATPTQLFFKRLMDIFGGLAGCMITLVIMIIFGPFIYVSSPGPIFFSQERVGRNGKRFKMYKFRTMYPDAEERKKELLAKNKVGDSRMFKLDFDPRVIGNKILPDGSTKEGIGSFLRKTSLDEFPQMFNILRGDMSLVGTRPPTVDEWESYELHHRARLSFRPGLTGLWQVSGRSNITDFEDVVKLDTEYIDRWSIRLDIKILLRTVKVVLWRDGAV